MGTWGRTSPTHGCRRGVPVLLLLPAVLAVLAGVVAVVGVAPARAQTVPDDVRLVPGYGGVGRADAWVPVTVTLRPDRPLDGVLQVVSTAATGSVVTARPLQVGGGAPVEVRLAVPPGRLEARVVAGGDVLAETPDQVTVDDAAGIVVGVLGAEEVDGPAVEVLPAEATARWVGVDQVWADQPRGLSGLDALVLPAGSWAQLGDATRRRTWTEVTARGMTLVVTDQVDAAALPRPPDADGTSHVVDLGDGRRVVVAGVGLGRVALVPGGPDAVRDGEVWAAVVGPRGVVDPAVDVEAHDTQPFAAQALLQQGGRPVEVAGIPYLGLFLLAYLLVVVPLNVVLLRRWGRPEMAWVSVPAVAVVFAAVPLLGSGPATGEAPMVVRSLTTWVDGAGEERVAASWRATRTGGVEARMDGAGWTGQPWGGQLSGAEVRPDDEGVTVVGDVRLGEVGGLLASRPAAAAPPATISALAQGDAVAVEVRNDGDEPLRDARLVVGNRVVEVGDLGPGEAATELVPGRLARRHMTNEALPEPAPPPPGVGGVVPAQLEGPQRAGLAPAALRVGTPGIAWLVGAVAESSTTPVVEGVAPDRTEGVVAVGTRIDVPSPVERIPPAAVPAQLLAPAAGPDQPHQLVNEAAGRSVLRITLPPLADGSMLAGALGGLEVRGGVQLWDVSTRRWVDATVDFAARDAAPLLTPTGQLYVRLGGVVDGAGVAVVQPGDPPPDPPEPMPGQQPGVGLPGPLPVPTTVPGTPLPPPPTPTLTPTLSPTPTPTPVAPTTDPAQPGGKAVGR